MHRPDDQKPDETAQPDVAPSLPVPAASPLVRRAPAGDPVVRPAFDATSETDHAATDRSATVSQDTIKHHQRKGNRALWISLAIMVAILVAVAGIGTFVRPSDDRRIQAVPTTGPATTTGPGGVPEAPTPTLSTGPGPARPADALGPWAGRIGTAADIPAVAVQAYAYAQLQAERTYPQCHLGWTTLAGLGQVDSQHGQAGGAVLDRAGRSTPPILGPPLDGQDGRPLVPDTDAGAYDGDVTFDRRMGPLMLLPSVWRANASDADADQIQDPYDLDDASVAMAKVLCASGDDLAQLAGWTAAIGRVQAGEEFAQAVFQQADSYGQRTRNVP